MENSIKEILQAFAPAGMTQLTQRFGLDLTDTLTGNIEFFTDLFQCSGTSVFQTKNGDREPFSHARSGWKAHR